MNLGKSIVKMFGAQLISSLASFVGVAIFARAIGAYQLGIFFLFQGVVSILAIPADIGLRGALEKRMSEGGDGASFVSTMLLMKLVPLGIVLTVIILFRTELQSYIGEDVVTYLVVALVVNEAYNVVMQVLRGELRVGDSANMMAIRQVLWVTLGAIAIWGLNLDAIGLIYAYIVGALLSLLYGLSISSTRLGTPSRDNARSLFRYAKFDLVAGVGANLYSWLDVLIIGFFLTQTEVGAYETAWRVSVAAVMFGMAIQSAIFPQFSDWSGSKNIERISNTLPMMITGSLFFVIPAFVGTLLFSGEILSYVFGEEFVIASVALIILMTHRIFQALNQTIGKTLQAIDHPDLAAYATAVGIVLNVVLNVVLITRFGLEGAAVATLVSFASMTLIRARYLTEFVPIRFEVSNLGWCAISAAVMGVVLYALQSVYQIRSLYGVALVVGVGGVVYILVILLSASFRTRLVRGARNAIG